ncbi:MAG: AzlD domain-containing protein [Halobacteriales archaeon]|nr:AzlD domain-containing protein [Halobacteriales archaeon]
MSLSDGLLWLIIVVIGIATFMLRLSFIALVGRFETVPAWLDRSLRYVPAAVLSALVWPSILQIDATLAVGADTPRLLAAGAAILVAWYTENVLATIVVGMGTLWLLFLIGF